MARNVAHRLVLGSRGSLQLSGPDRRAFVGSQVRELGWIMVAEIAFLDQLRAQLAAQVRPPLAVSARATQHQLDEDSSSYSEIDVRDGEEFAIVVVLGGGGDASDGFITRIWHRHAAEVWLLDPQDLTITVAPRTGEVQVFTSTGTLVSTRLPGVALSLASLFGAVN